MPLAPHLLCAFGLALAMAQVAQADQIIDLPGGVPTPVPGTDLTVMLSGVVDQRCPAHVACVWEGMIKAEISILSGSGTTGTLTLCNACAAADVPQVAAGKTFALVALQPGRDVLDPLNRLTVLGDYTLQVAVAP